MEKYEPGTIIGDRYELLQKLGSGGMASVYKAIDRFTKNYVAVKVIDQKTVINPNGLERFQIEKESIANLTSSKYVVTLYDVIQENSEWLLILEYVEGWDFKKYLATFAPLNTNEIKYFFGTLCDALSEVHKGKIVHRDIKPENVLLTTDKQIKLTDFGISIMEGYVKEETKVIGTPKYMAPEVLEEQKAIPRTDIYALGIMMYEAATGITPFRKKDHKKIIVEHFLQKPVSPRNLNPTIPQSLENIILKMIEKDPALRFQSMNEVKAALENVNENIVVKPYVYNGRYKSNRKSKKTQKVTKAMDLYTRTRKFIKQKTIIIFIISFIMLLFALLGILLWLI